MLDNLFSRPGVVARFRHGPLAGHLDELAQTLLSQGYARSTAQMSVRSAAHFSRWLARRGIAIDAVTDDVVARYLAGLKRYRHGRSKAGQGLTDIVRILRQHGVPATVECGESRSDVDCWLDLYNDHLRDVAGLRPGTRRNYVREAGYFMAARFASGTVCWRAVSASDLSTFVRKRVEARRGHGRSTTGSALRSLLRFLVFRGEVEAGLDGAIPAVPQWTHETLPVRLREDEVEHVLETVRTSGATNALRDYAILALIGRLGLRAHEVAGLRLDDVDWEEGRIRIHPGKTDEERVLPLSQETGAALADYLRHGRVRSDSRIMFLKGVPPYSPFARAASVGEVARAAMERAGITLRHGMGAHTFRRTVASRMVNNGVTFKGVADVLGHRSLQSTGVYAKLDLDALHRVALPWAGGAS